MYRPLLGLWFEDRHVSNLDKGRDCRPRGRKLSLEPLEQRNLLSATPSGVMPPGGFPVLPQTHLSGDGAYLSGPSGDAPFDIAIDFVTDNAAELGLATSDLHDYLVTDHYRGRHNGVTHVYLQQTYRGLPVLDATINVNVGTDGRVINAGCSFMPGLGAIQDKLLPEPTITRGN